MPWCPKCREEYREGFTRCSDCDVELVDYLEPLDNLEPEENTNSDEQYEEEAYLTSVADGIEAAVIESLLDSYEIPVFKKYKEAGGYLNIYMGNTLFGVDIFVPESLLEKAKEIIESTPSEESEVEELDESEEEKE